MNFYKYATLETKIIYLFSIVVVVGYIIEKLVKKKYILSIFNFQLYIYLFSYFIISIFQYDDIAWKALGENNAKYFYKYLDKNLQINLIGIILFFLFLYYFEIRKKFFYKEARYEHIIEKNFNIKLLNYMNIVIVLFWYILVWSSIGFSLPIFKNREFLASSSLQSIYNILNNYLSVITGINMLFLKNRSKLQKIFLGINIITLLGTGNRGEIFSIFLMKFIFYMKNKKVNFSNIIKYLIIGSMILTGIVIVDTIRGGNNSSFIFKIKYGNTFSDIRDGAFILYGMEKLKISFIYGKMYLADLLAFIPSEFIQYRENYAYSNFTTKYLFGWNQHYGLRGGIFLAPYINFGYLGVVIFSYISAKILAKLENCYFKDKITYKNYYYYLILNTLCYSLLITAGFMSVYIILGQIMLNIILNKVIKIRK